MTNLKKYMPILVVYDFFEIIAKYRENRPQVSIGTNSVVNFPFFNKNMAYDISFLLDFVQLNQ